MSDCYIGEIRAFPYSYVPYGWLLCDGTTYNTGQYPALASLLGNTFGGNWPATFTVPDLRQRIAVSVGEANELKPHNFELGKPIGEAAVQLSYYPRHTHTLQKKNVKGGALAKTSRPNIHSNFGQVTGPNNTTYMASSPGSATTQLSPNMLSFFGKQPVAPHENRQPFLNMLYAIAHDGEYPVPED
ncbi:phage tail protein [Sphingomonas pokkalii]|uniref:Phage tail collar domain-containing protein n=1 Tax=Sphingomonas pokkalii TaxID=2175090 RepID=A0A2U0SGC9_9SPHN|nr:tail fiber protein [Sphingomonas pokkalii]PVX30387.1 hypothetical protein DD559_14415 [Sphingomonas pokkalii]